jgi:DNA-directed RNA polymerase subunit RPC12/RpoP
MPTLHREITCPLCGGRMLYGRARIEKGATGQMAWHVKAGFLEFAPDAAMSEKEVVLGEKNDVEGYRCLQCRATLITVNSWS